MINEYGLYDEQIMSGLKIENMLKRAELERMKRKASLLNRKKEEKNVISLILTGAGNALVSTGSKLLDIA
jgi:hypothetical protein